MGNTLMHAPSFDPKPKNPPTPKKDNLAKNIICHQCGEVGHWRRNCPIYLAELIKKIKLSQGASTLVLTSVVKLLRVFSKGSRKMKLKLGALSLYLGDGHRTAVEAIGEFHLCLPSRLVLILHNCHYAPSITRGIISDNIYEIVMSSSNTNDSSMFAVSNKRAKLNLDYALLWHCRLRHISKKCIEKLQHDGILNSTNIKSFEKCVSCMSGKMARKSYSHQVERAKDLLGLIHTDDTQRKRWDILSTTHLRTKSLLLGMLNSLRIVLYNSRRQRYANGNIRAPDRMCLYIDAEEHELGDLVDLPPDGKPLVNKVALQKKTDIDEAIVRTILILISP
ncbi:retrotransposon protein, putative, ty1-copia subclass [Tanacetum coccineum]